MSISNLSLKGKVAVVTGGGTGIGTSITLELARAGADVIVASRNLANLEKVAAEVKKLGRRSMAVATDVSKKPSVDSLFQTVMDKFGKVDILVNDAGGSAHERNSLFCKSTEEVWDYVIGINLKGVFNCTRAVINHMIERKSGKIVNIASLDGVLGGAGRADYSAVKAAIIGFSKALSKEVVQYRINVNCISPGPIETGYNASTIAKHTPEIDKWYKSMAEKTGFGWGKAEDVANVAVFLASDEANYITGQNIPVCGLANINLLW